VSQVFSAIRDRVEKLLGMLGSSFAGERANAAAALSRVAREHKLTIVELLQGVFRGDSPRSSQTRNILDELAQALAYEHALTDWEVTFGRDGLRRYHYPSQLSEKQKSAAEKIIIKAQRAAMAEGGMSS
jgi:hypothetical protein